MLRPIVLRADDAVGGIGACGCPILTRHDKTPHPRADNAGMVTAELTEGMMSLEVCIVTLASAASQEEREYLAAF